MILTIENSPIKRCKHMSNPKNFCEEAKNIGITYEYLINSKLSINTTNLARMFIGKSSRGGVSADIIETWINTFEYVLKHPNEDDHDQYTARRIEPTKAYYDYITLIKTPIPDEIIKSWEDFSPKKLGIEVKKYGYIIGIANNAALKTLRQRVEDMITLRRNTLWNKKEEIIESKKDIIDYRLMNVLTLRSICKERNLHNAHIKTKDTLIKLLENNPNIIVKEMKDDENNSVGYSKMNVKELKTLAKERGLTHYNNLKKDELVKLHEEFDEDIEFIEDKENVNVIEEVAIKNESKISEFLKVFTFDGKQIRTTGTFDNPWFVVKDICDILDIKDNRVALRNIPEKWKDEYKTLTLGGPQNMTTINEAGVYKLIMRSNKPNAEKFQEFVCEDVLPSIRKTGSFTLENKYKFILENNRPLSQILNSNNFDKEAKEIENIYDWSKNSNCPIIYIAYIGTVDNIALIKIGFSDSKFDERLSKHVSSESQYEQFRILNTFEVSGKPIEDVIHGLLQTYRYPFKVQKEIYKTSSSLKDFVNTVHKLLEDNDYKLKYNKLLEKYNEIEKKNLELQLQIQKIV